jgi:hypothetical protein
MTDTDSRSSRKKGAQRKRLPKDFEQLLEKGDLPALKAVFDTCDINARGGYAQGTALMLSPCPEEFARWLVAQGADLAAVDSYGNTALHAQARNRDGCVGVLIELGADVNAGTASGSAPLHAAVDAKNAAHVATLLAHGADVNARNLQHLTPLEYGLVRARNIDLASMATIARMLLDAGAIKSTESQSFVRKLGETFEFHRHDFSKDSLEAADHGLAMLYELFDVVSVPRRQMHDGKAPITVAATAWQGQYEELWSRLVPSRGPAATVQGEVIRIAGRIGHEIRGNGGVNWDRDFEMMARALCEHLRTGTPLSADELQKCEAVVRSVIKNQHGDVDRLAESAVAWVLNNREPVELTTPPYSR